MKLKRSPGLCAAYTLYTQYTRSAALKTVLPNFSLTNGKSIFRLVLNQFNRTDLGKIYKISILAKCRKWRMKSVKSKFGPSVYYTNFEHAATSTSTFCWPNDLLETFPHDPPLFGCSFIVRNQNYKPFGSFWTTPATLTEGPQQTVWHAWSNQQLVWEIYLF